MRRLSAVCLSLLATAACMCLAQATSLPVIIASADTQLATAPKPEQPAEFKALAEKARVHEGVWAKGAMKIDDKNLPEEMQKVSFELWVKGPAAKHAVTGLIDEVRVTDGAYVYAYRKSAGEAGEGRRRKLSEANLYSSLEVAALMYDALSGYANLAAGVKLLPLEDAKLSEKHPKLKWFELRPAGQSLHYLLRNTRTVRLGVSEEDGLPRVMTGLVMEKAPDSASQPKDAKDARKDSLEVAVTLSFETVKIGEVQDSQLLLPSSAARAKWQDMDKQEPINPPAALIAKE